MLSSWYHRKFGIVWANYRHSRFSKANSKPWQFPWKRVHFSRVRPFDDHSGERSMPVCIVGSEVQAHEFSGTMNKGTWGKHLSRSSTFSLLLPQNTIIIVPRGVIDEGPYCKQETRQCFICQILELKISIPLSFSELETMQSVSTPSKIRVKKWIWWH